MAEIRDKVLIFISRHRILRLYQKGTYYMGLKIYNRLPAYIKAISQIKKVLKLLL
jgi:hypothetical protein